VGHDHERPVEIDAAERRFLDLISVIRHELTAPLSVIRGYARMLDPEHTGEVPSAEEVSEAFPAIRRNAELALLLLHRLRHADEVLDEESIDLERAEIDLVDLTETIVDDVCETLLQSHRVEVDAPEGEVIAMVDPTAIRQILLNLLSNAVKYTAADTTIHIVVRAQGERAEIAVTDEGEGIAPEDIERAFEAFSRVSKEDEGTGLGLAVSRALARAHGGDLTAEPAPEGSGARFVLSLPASQDI
jgi:signal transduction histidine kinase